MIPSDALGLADLPRAPRRPASAWLRRLGLSTASDPWVADLREWPAERYDLTGRLHPLADIDAAPADHFVRMTEFEARRFVVGEVRDVLWLRVSRAVGAPGRGLIDEFNVSGGAGVPRDLLAHDVRAHDRGWSIDPGDVEPVHGLSIPFCHYGVTAFAHLVMDGLMQVFLFERQLSRGEARLVDWPFAFPRMAQALDAVGVPASARLVLSKPAARLERAGLSSALAAQGVFFPGSWSAPFFTWLKEKLTGGASRGSPRRLYVRRADAFTRRVLDPEPLERLAEFYGFEVFTPEDHDLAGQVRAFAEAEVVMGAFGSGMTLTPLIRGRRLMIELLPSAVTDACFVRQAAVHGLSYLPIWHPSNGAGDFVPDLDRIARVLERLPR